MGNRTTQDTPSLFAVRVWTARRCYPHGIVHYWRPRRITASFRERHVYRWLIFNVAPKGLPK